MKLTRNNIAVVVAEFLGTAMLTLVILSVSKSNFPIPYFVATVAGMALIVGTLVLGRVSGAHFNPAVTLGLFSVRRAKALPTISYIAAQLLGGIAAYYLFTYFIDQTWDNVEGTFSGRALVAEAAGAFILSLGYAAAVYEKMENGMRAVVVGLSFAAAMFIAYVGTGATGGIVNPAIALGAQSWVLSTYVLGPVLGAIIGFNLYSLLFAPANELTARAEKASKKK